MEHKQMPTLFIGSSSEGKQIAEYLQLALEGHCETTLWSQGVFGLSGSNLENLIKATNQFEFAVLVLTPDDMVTKKGSMRSAARDNVLFESGLFMGSLGRDRTFLVYCQDDKIDIPSDLAGITAATYRKRGDGNMQAAVGPVALIIREAIRNAQRKSTSQASPKKVAATDTMEIVEHYPISSDFYRYVCDLLVSLASGISGIGLEVRDKKSLLAWSGNLLGMLSDLYIRRQTDAFAAWLRPRDTTPDRLSVFESRNLKEENLHYEFHLGEGLAGRVWSTGIPAATSSARQHPWWVYREGCDSVTYICVPVGKAGGSGGVLSVASDIGFILEDYDIEVVKVFASILALRVSSE